MVYITQLLFVKKGKENAFLGFEEKVIPLMNTHNGRIVYRIRPTKETYISFEQEELPYEIHIVSFDTEKDFRNYLNDDSRLKFMHLKEESIKTTITIKGGKL